jgi:16S rRNA (cytosine1402-N4)-methyltransferase
LGHTEQFKIVTKHPLQPTDEESASNPASRSAKLRALEMI